MEFMNDYDFWTNFHVSKTILHLEYLMISTRGELQLEQTLVLVNKESN